MQSASCLQGFVTVYFVMVSIGDYLHGTVEISPADIDSGLGIAFQCFWVGMAHVVEVAAGKYYCTGADCIDEILRIGKPTTVM